MECISLYICLEEIEVKESGFMETYGWIKMMFKVFCEDKEEMPFKNEYSKGIECQCSGQFLLVDDFLQKWKLALSGLSSSSRYI